MIFARLLIVVALIFGSLFLFSKENLEKVKNLDILKQDRHLGMLTEPVKPAITPAIKPTIKPADKYIFSDKKLSICEYYSDWKECKE